MNNTKLNNSDLAEIKHSDTKNETERQALISSQRWHSLNWKEIYRVVEEKQNAIASAMIKNDTKAVYQIQRLLVTSFEARALAVRKVITNTGGKTPGIDNIILDKPEQYYDMIKEILEIVQQPGEYIAKPIRRILIPKENGGTRPLGIPTIKDRIVQAVYHLAVDPAVETRSDKFSFGFRKKRSTHDAIAYFRNYMDKTISPRWVLEADITKCFDKINHEYLLKHTPICDKNVLKQWLKSGAIEQGKYRPTQEATAQGTIISPTLCNVALNGLEETIKNQFRDPSKRTSAKIQVIRYADDVVITGKNKEILEKARQIMEEFIGKRGLQLNKTKTRISDITDGIDLLGFNVSRKLFKSNMNRKNSQQDVLIIKPSNKSILSIRNKITKAFKELNTMDEIIMKLNPILRGWIEHKRISWHSQTTFRNLNKFIWEQVRTKFVKSKPARSSQRINYKEIKGEGGWTSRSGKVLLDPMKISTIKFRLMKLDLNPYLIENKKYFEEKKESRILSAIRSKLFKKYDNKCTVCQQSLLGNEIIEIHHIKLKKEGGTNSIRNLMPLHRICHIKITHETNPINKE